MKAYSISEIAQMENVTRDGLLRWIKRHDPECMITETNRRFFTASQLKKLRAQRASRKRNEQSGRS